MTELCLWCKEPLTNDIDRRRNIRAHVECSIRLVIGPASHLRKNCPCYGGFERDPEGFSKRDAARMTVLEALKMGLPLDFGVMGWSRSELQRFRPSNYAQLPKEIQHEIDATLNGTL